VKIPVGACRCEMTQQARWFSKADSHVLLLLKFQSAGVPIVLLDEAAQASATQLARDAEPAPMRPRQPSDVMRLMYTSGTTDCPKGVMLTYENMYWTSADQTFGARTECRFQVACGRPALSRRRAGSCLACVPSPIAPGWLQGAERACYSRQLAPKSVRQGACRAPNWRPPDETAAGDLRFALERQASIRPTEMVAALLSRAWRTTWSRAMFASSTNLPKTPTAKVGKPTLRAEGVQGMGRIANVPASCPTPETVRQQGERWKSSS
jgi:acyl-CoA synthetase (AMP-forming)/AMP-acid ligase II